MCTLEKKLIEFAFLVKISNAISFFETQSNKKLASSSQYVKKNQIDDNVPFYWNKCELTMAQFELR